MGRARRAERSAVRPGPIGATSGECLAQTSDLCGDTTGMTRARSSSAPCLAASRGIPPKGPAKLPIQGRRRPLGASEPARARPGDGHGPVDQGIAQVRGVAEGGTLSGRAQGEYNTSATDPGKEAADIMNETSPQSLTGPGAQQVTAPPSSVPSPSPRRLFIMAVVAAVLGLGITLSFGYAEHDPKPHEVEVDVAAPAAVRANVAAGLQQTEPNGFDLVSVPSGRAAIESVRSQTSAGALIVPLRGAVTIVTAGAEGTLQQQAITATLTAASQSMHRPTKPLDVAPLTTGDRSGLSSFVFGLGLLLPSVIGGIGIFLLGMRLRLWWRVAGGARSRCSRLAAASWPRTRCLGRSPAPAAHSSALGSSARSPSCCSSLRCKRS